MSATEDIVSRVRADLQRAKAAAEKARTALDSAETQVSELTIFLRMLERYAGTNPIPTGLGRGGEHGENNLQSSIPARGTNSRVLVDACIVGIEQAGRPLTIGELVDVCLKQGIKIGGRDLKSNLAGYLSRDRRVVSLGRGVGWAVVATRLEDMFRNHADATPSLTAEGVSEVPDPVFQAGEAGEACI